jgi:hypothetical protein
MLANTIRVMNGKVPLDQQINLKGFMVYLIVSYVTLNIAIYYIIGWQWVCREYGWWLWPDLWTQNPS